MESIEEFQHKYIELPDMALCQLAVNIPDLKPNAQKALKLELQSRGFSVEDYDWNAQPAEVNKPTGAWRRGLRNFGIFVLCDLVYTAILAIPFAKISDDAMQSFLTVMFAPYWKLAVVVAFFTARYFVPKQTRTIWIIGAIGPLLWIVFVLYFVTIRR